MRVADKRSGSVVDDVISPYGAQVLIDRVQLRCDKVVIGPRQVRQRQLRNHIHRNWAEHACRNDVVAELRPARALRGAGCGIKDRICCRQTTKVAGAECGYWNGREDAASGTNANSLVIAEKK